MQISSPPGDVPPKPPTISGRPTVSDPVRSRDARALAERALVRLVQAYGEVPEFVLLGGLVPDLLCGSAAFRHVGTTDVDVQVDLELHEGSRNAAHLEQALTESGFVPDSERAWRWRDTAAPQLQVKVEFLADLPDVPDHQSFSFDGCTALGAINLRGTGFAAQDWELREVRADVEGLPTTVQIRVATLPAYLLAKVHAAYGRGLVKDWYDIAYVLLHNDEAGAAAAARRVRERFGSALVVSTATALSELSANFADADTQGSIAFATTMVGLHAELDADQLANDAVAAIGIFIASLRMDEG